MLSSQRMACHMFARGLSMVTFWFPHGHPPGPSTSDGQLATHGNMKLHLIPMNISPMATSTPFLKLSYWFPECVVAAGMLQTIDNPVSNHWQTCGNPLANLWQTNGQPLTHSIVS